VWVAGTGARKAARCGPRISDGAGHTRVRRELRLTAAVADNRPDCRVRERDSSSAVKEPSIDRRCASSPRVARSCGPACRAALAPATADAATEGDYLENWRIVGWAAAMTMLDRRVRATAAGKRWDSGRCATAGPSMREVSEVLGG
jgi:hypothetical protein